MGLLFLPQLVRSRKPYPQSKHPTRSYWAAFDAQFKERKGENILKSLNDKTQWENSKTPVTERYAVSKLLNLYVTLELARHTPLINGRPAVVVNNVTAGFFKSELLAREPRAPFMLKFWNS
jgi:hypothetical protein